jgi:S-adenosylmethionine hydrolase
VVAVSANGNLITDITADQLRDVPRNDSVTVRCDEHETIGLYALGHAEPEMTLLALVGDSGKLELEIVGDSAKIMLGVRIGEKVSVKW